MKDIGILACLGVLLYSFTPKLLPLPKQKKVEQETAAPVAATFQR